MMLRRLLAPALVLFSVTACAKSPAPAPAASVPAPVAVVTAPVAATVMAPAASVATTVAMQAAPVGAVPQPGVDYVVLPQQQPYRLPARDIDGPSGRDRYPVEREAGHSRRGRSASPRR